MPNQRFWNCGHCGYGPMAIKSHVHCVMCHKARDGYATYEATASNSPDDIPQPQARLSQYRSAQIVSGSRVTPSIPSLVGELFVGTAAPSSEHIQAFLPISFGPPRYWYCHACGDGPKNMSVEVACCSCGHKLCSYCKRRWYVTGYRVSSIILIHLQISANHEDSCRAGPDGL